MGRGDDATATELSWLLAMAQRWAGSQDGQDLAHDAWIAGRNGSSPPQGRAWWSGVVRNRWKMEVRTATRRREREGKVGSLEPTHALDPERVAAQRGVGRILRESLEALDPLEQTIVVRRHCDGLNASEIAAELGLPAATVRTKLRRALQRLRSSLDERWEERDQPWQWALLPVTGATRTQPVAAAGSWLTWALIAALAGSVVVVLARMGSPQATDAEAPYAAVANNEPGRVSAEAWAARRKAIRAARARRIAAGAANWATFTAPDEVDDAADALSGLFFGDAAAASRLALEALGSQASETLRECAHDNPSPGGTLEVRAHLIAEPDVGTIVESTEVKQDTIGDPELIECVRESTYTYTFPEPTHALYLAHDFTVDMSTKQVAAAGVLPLDRLPDVLERYPEYLEALPSVLERLPAIAAPMRKLVEADPTLRDRMPHFVELIGADESPFP